MRLLRADSISGRRVFRMEARERDLFFEALGLYPLGQGVLREPHPDRKTQAKVAEALAACRERNQVAAELLRKACVLEIDKDFNEHCDLNLPPAEAETLLQILNDVRVGLWIQLGRPEAGAEPAALAAIPEEKMRGYILMHLCGEWEYHLLAAFDPDPGKTKQDKGNER